MIFAGVDGAGKGETVNLLSEWLDPRWLITRASASRPTRNWNGPGSGVIGAPFRRAHHYLWRFWRHLPRAGVLTTFDRSWYGRVLVERVEGFAAPEEWRRAYHEINEFEDQLVEHGIVLIKCWLHITRNEQLRRFKERQASPFKSWKLSDEDWRNRKQWDAYAHAVNEMVERTSTRVAPWTIVESNDKYYARIKVLQTICDRLESVLD